MRCDDTACLARREAEWARECGEAVCFFAGWPDAGACDGQLVRGHIVPRQLLKRTYPHGALLDEDGWRPMTRYEDRYDLRHRTLQDLIDDQRSWVPVCGGATGVGAHHGRLDIARTLRIPRERIPEGTEQYAAELGLGWYLDRAHGPREMAA